MKFLIRFVLLIFVIAFITSCAFLFTKKHLVSFECGSDELITLNPPKGTYKCQIKLISYCSILDSIQILSNGKIQKSHIYGTDKKGVIMKSDWYSGELGIQYISKQSENLIKKTHTVDLEVIFYKN